MATLIRVSGGVDSKPNTVTVLSASQTFTVPSGVTKLYLWMCGGGSVGIPRFDTSGSSFDYFCGGFSAMPREYVIDVNPGDSYSVVIGAAGAITSGAAGGDTSFGSCSAAGASYYAIGNSITLLGNASGGMFHANDIFSIAQGEAGNAGSLDALGHSGVRGYCSLTEEIYCGGGALAVFRPSAGTHNSGSWSAGPTSVPAGGGPALPSCSASYSGTYSSLSVSGSITPASKWGAGGVSFLCDLTYTGTDYENTTKFSPYQGVCIVGY